MTGSSGEHQPLLTRRDGSPSRSSSAARERALPEQPTRESSGGADPADAALPSSARQLLLTILKLSGPISLTTVVEFLPQILISAMVGHANPRTALSLHDDAWTSDREGALLETYGLATLVYSTAAFSLVYGFICGLDSVASCSYGMTVDASAAEAHGATTLTDVMEEACSSGSDMADDLLPHSNGRSEHVDSGSSSRRSSGPFSIDTSSATDAMHGGNRGRSPMRLPPRPTASRTNSTRVVTPAVDPRVAAALRAQTPSTGRQAVNWASPPLRGVVAVALSPAQSALGGGGPQQQPLNWPRHRFSVSTTRDQSHLFGRSSPSRSMSLLLQRTPAEQVTTTQSAHPHASSRQPSPRISMGGHSTGSSSSYKYAQLPSATMPTEGFLSASLSASPAAVPATPTPSPEPALKTKSHTSHTTGSNQSSAMDIVPAGSAGSRITSGGRRSGPASPRLGGTQASPLPLHAHYGSISPSDPHGGLLGGTAGAWALEELTSDEREPRSSSHTARAAPNGNSGVLAASSAVSSTAGSAVPGAAAAAATAAAPAQPWTVVAANNHRASRRSSNNPPGGTTLPAAASSSANTSTIAVGVSPNMGPLELAPSPQHSQDVAGGGRSASTNHAAPKPLKHYGSSGSSNSSMPAPSPSSSSSGPSPSSFIGTWIARCLMLELVVVLSLIVLLHWGTEPLLRALGEPAESIPVAAAYVTAASFGLPFVAVYHALNKGLQSSGVVMPILLISVVTKGACLLAVYVALYHLAANLVAVAWILSATMAAQASAVYMFMRCTGIADAWWGRGASGSHSSSHSSSVAAAASSVVGVAEEVLSGVLSWAGLYEYVVLALPACMAICLEFWLFDLLGALAGLLPDPATELAVHYLLFTATLASYMVFSGLSVSVSVLVGQRLGCAGQSANAKKSAIVGTSACLCVSACLMLFIALFHDTLARALTSQPILLARFAECVPVLVAYQAVDGLNTCSTQLLRTLGVQRVGVLLHFATYYMIGMSASCLLAFYFGLGVLGLWMGLTAGVGLNAIVATVWLWRFADWEDQSAAAQSRASAMCTAGDTPSAFLPNTDAYAGGEMDEAQMHPHERSTSLRLLQSGNAQADHHGN